MKGMLYKLYLHVWYHNGYGNYPWWLLSLEDEIVLRCEMRGICKLLVAVMTVQKCLTLPNYYFLKNKNWLK